MISETIPVMRNSNSSTDAIWCHHLGLDWVLLLNGKVSADINQHLHMAKTVLWHKAVKCTASIQQNAVNN